MRFQGARSGLKMGLWLPAVVVVPWFVRPGVSRAPGAALWALQCCRARELDSLLSRQLVRATTSVKLRVVTMKEGNLVLEETQDEQEIVVRVAALDIGKAELVCCLRVPRSQGRVSGVQESRRPPR